MTVCEPEEVLSVAKKKGEGGGGTDVVAFRLSDDLVKRLDAQAARLSAQMPGATFNRTAVVRMLLLKGLDAEELLSRAQNSGAEQGKRGLKRSKP